MLGIGNNPRLISSVPLFRFAHRSQNLKKRRMAISANVPENAIFDIEIGDIVHYICQHDDELTEETYDGQLNAPLLVGSAKPGTHGTYALFGDEVGSLSHLFSPFLPLISRLI